MIYSVLVQLNSEQLEELIELDLSRDLAEKFQRALDQAHDYFAAMDHAERVNDRLSWNSEMRNLFGEAA